jgi:hypothetical protein
MLLTEVRQWETAAGGAQMHGPVCGLPPFLQDRALFADIYTKIVAPDRLAQGKGVLCFNQPIRARNYHCKKPKGFWYGRDYREVRRQGD